MAYLHKKSGLVNYTVGLQFLIRDMGRCILYNSRDSLSLCSGHKEFKEDFKPYLEKGFEKDPNIILFRPTYAYLFSMMDIRFIPESVVAKKDVSEIQTYYGIENYNKDAYNVENLKATLDIIIHSSDFKNVSENMKTIDLFEYEKNGFSVITLFFEDGKYMIHYFDYAAFDDMEFKELVCTNGTKILRADWKEWFGYYHEFKYICNKTLDELQDPIMKEAIKSLNYEYMSIETYRELHARPDIDEPFRKELEEGLNGKPVQVGGVKSFSSQTLN